ncbi:hypothetical protein JCGZ_05473 [Jatropha curcas]|uniref:Uncharacterized protein n=1 Tax=Jatropha curcas TaxID=180498 RepID=A0A067KKH8_JATCU|nr:hypothetical protein JCGZ_12052 [Jatropha curcas]KDP35599.1 hypothetical protein JCGZ_09037 [Jatropha curcas]KDP44006.1 hypothetical protein JCGZ_05473 [Jatropha curcas]
MPPVTWPVLLHVDQAFSGDDASLFFPVTQQQLRRRSNDSGDEKLLVKTPWPTARKELSSLFRPSEPLAQQMIVDLDSSQKLESGGGNLARFWAFANFRPPWTAAAMAVR